MIKEVIEKIIEFVVQNFLVDAEDIFIDESLIDQGIIDSTGLLEIITFLEEEYSIVIDEDDLIRDNFGSVIKIANFIFDQVNKQNSFSSVA